MFRDLLSGIFWERWEGWKCPRGCESSLFWKWTQTDVHPKSPERCCFLLYRSHKSFLYVYFHCLIPRANARTYKHIDWPTVESQTLNSYSHVHATELSPLFFHSQKFLQRKGLCLIHLFSPYPAHSRLQQMWVQLMFITWPSCKTN